MSYAVAQQEYVRKASNDAVTYPTGGSWLGAYAIYLGATEPNGTWVQTICNQLGVTEPLNGSWVQALANYYGITSADEYGNWWTALAEHTFTPIVGFNWETDTNFWEAETRTWSLT